MIIIIVSESTMWHCKIWDSTGILLVILRAKAATAFSTS